MHNTLNVFQFWPDWTTELPTLEHPKKYPNLVIMRKMVSQFFLVVYLLENYSKYFDDFSCWLSG